LEGFYGNSGLESSVFFSEGMDLGGNYKAFSGMSLSILKDTNWYADVDISHAHFYHLGKNKGCNFLEDTCQNLNALPEYSYALTYLGFLNVLMYDWGTATKPY